MSLLNKVAYAVMNDKLIYDGIHPIDGGAVEVKTPEGTGGIKRGQIIDVTADGEYVLHADKGTPSVIAAENVEYAEDEDTVTVPIYISGTFRKSEVISDVELTAGDLETLRSKSIYLK